MNTRKVLIVDDEEVIRKVLRMTLNKWGFQAEEAGDGVQALRRLREGRYDLIICDILMPNMNGWDLIREVRRNPDTQDLRIIALTGKNKDIDMFKGYELGATYYMTKPFTKAQLHYGLQLVLDDSPEGVQEVDLSQQFEIEGAG